MARLIKSEKVLVPILHDEKGSFYGYIDDDTDQEVIVLTLGKKTVDDLGKPSHITVTIKPGDQLNGN